MKGISILDPKLWPIVIHTEYWVMIKLGGSGEILFVNQSNFFLNNNADRHPSSRNTQQEYSFHLYCGGASPTKHPISTILCNYAPASGKSRQVCPNASQSWFKHLDSLHIYSIGATIRKNDKWNSLDGPKWRHTLTSVQIQCTVRWNYARWGQIWAYKKKKKKKKNDCRGPGSLSTCRRYVLTHYFEGLMELTCVAGEIRRTAMSKHGKQEAHVGHCRSPEYNERIQNLTSEWNPKQQSFIPHATRSLLCIRFVAVAFWAKKQFFLRWGPLWPIFALPWIRPWADMAETS